MGKHLKTSMDYKVVEYLAIELWRKDPNNKVLHKFMAMKNEEGNHIRKTIETFDKTGAFPTKYNTDGPWNMTIPWLRSHATSIITNAFEGISREYIG